jgi:transcriptional regulator with XRE-family HTH domain
MSLKDKINKIIVEQKISGAQFARDIGIQRSAAYNILKGKTKKLNPETAKKIAATYNEYSYSWLVETDDNSTEIIDLNLDINKAAQIVANNFEEALNTNRVLFLEVERYSRDYLIKYLESKGHKVQK